MADNARLIARSSRFLRRLEFATADHVDAAPVASFVRASAQRLAFFKENWEAVQAGTRDPSGR
ncbi:MAG TPA: hypothetical protein VIH37_12800 [Candidatus Limnocylindrales bacterium]